MEGRSPGAAERADINLANWNWKVVRRFVQERFGLLLSSSSCLNYLHRLGFVLKRPKKHFLKADDAKRETFVAAYAALLIEARQVGTKVFFADETHFRADADLRGKWVLKGEPALVDSTSPRWGEKASYYSAVCLETGEVETMELQGYSNAETSTAFLKQLRDKHAGPLSVIWDNAPAHRGDAMRAYLATPDLRLRLVSLPGYIPDFNAAEAIWDWARKRSPPTYVWAQKPRCRISWDTSSPSWPTGLKKSGIVVRPSCKHGQRSSSRVPKPVLITLCM